MTSEAHQHAMRGWEWRMLRGLVEPNSLRLIGEHTGEVKALGFVGNDHLITGIFGQSPIAIWNARSGTLLREVKGQSAYDLAVHPAGRIFAAVGYTNEVHLYEVESFLRIKTLQGKGNQATVRFSPDGSHLAALSKESLRIWSLTWGPDDDLKEAHLAAELPASSFWTLAFSPTGDSLVYLSDEGPVVYSIPQREASKLPDLGMSVAGASFSPDGSFLAAVGWGGQLALVDLMHRDVHLLHQYEQALRVVAFSEGGTTLVTAGDSGLLHVWDVSERRERATLMGHTDLVSSLAFSEDGRRLATGSKDQTCRIWDIFTPPNQLASIESVPCRKVLGGSPDGRFLLVSEAKADVALWDLQQHLKSTISSDPRIATASSAAVAPNGSKAVIACTDQSVALWDFEQDDAIAVIPVRVEVNHLAFSRDSNWFAVAARDQPFVVYDSNTGEPKATLNPPPSVRSDLQGRVAFGLDERTLIAGRGSHLFSFDIQSQSLMSGPCLAHDRGFGLLLAPQGDIVATFATDNRLHLWDSATLTPLATNLPCYGDWGSVAFDAEGKRVFVTAKASHVAVFNTSSAIQIALLEPGIGRITHLQFCPKSDTLAIFGGEGHLQFWRAPSFAEIEAAERERASLQPSAE
jgi:WD40 repeat protein